MHSIISPVFYLFCHFYFYHHAVTGFSPPFPGLPGAAVGKTLIPSLVIPVGIFERAELEPEGGGRIPPRPGIPVVGVCFARLGPHRPLGRFGIFAVGAACG